LVDVTRIKVAPMLQLIYEIDVKSWSLNGDVAGISRAATFIENLISHFPLFQQVDYLFGSKKEKSEEGGLGVGRY
jgi:hypothetical protein